MPSRGPVWIWLAVAAIGVTGLVLSLTDRFPGALDETGNLPRLVYLLGWLALAGGGLVFAIRRQPLRQLRNAAIWLGIGLLLVVAYSFREEIAPRLMGELLPQRGIANGDRVRITGVRDFTYRTRNDFTVRYEEREVQLAHLVALDFYVSYFMEGPVGHTFLSFIFDNAPPLTISIETRPEVGEGFAPVASMFKQFELIYVVGSERDVVGVRTNHRSEPTYLYRLNTSPENVRRLFLIYLERINELAGVGGLDIEDIDIHDVEYDFEAAEVAARMARSGEVSAIMKGSLHTDVLMHAIVSREAGLRTSMRMSHVFAIDHPGYHKLLLVTDAAINMAPSLGEKRDIVRSRSMRRSTGSEWATCIGAVVPSRPGSPNMAWRRSRRCW